MMLVPYIVGGSPVISCIMTTTGMYLRAAVRWAPRQETPPL